MPSLAQAQTGTALPAGIGALPRGEPAACRPAGHVRRRAALWARVAVSAGLLTALLLSLDVGRVAGAVSAARAAPLAALLALVFTERFLSAYRWYAVLRWSGVAAAWPAVLRISFASWFLGLFLPGAVGTEMLRAVGLARHTADTAASVSSVLVDRFLSVATLVPFVVAGLLLNPGDLPTSLSIVVGAALTAMLVGAAAAMHPGARAVLERLMPVGLRRRVRPRLRRLYEALDSYKGRPGLLAWSVVLAAALQIVRIAVAVAAAQAMGITAPLAYFALFVPITNFVALMPISLGGLGIRELGFIYFLNFAGARPEHAFAASLLIYIAGTLSVLPGAWCCAGLSRRVEEGARSCARS